MCVESVLGRQELDTDFCARSFGPFLLSTAPAYSSRRLVMIRAVSPPVITPEVSPGRHGEAGPVGRILMIINIDLANRSAARI